MHTLNYGNLITSVQTNSTGATQIELADLLAEEGRSRRDARLTTLARKYRMGKIVDRIYLTSLGRSKEIVESIARQHGVSPSTLWHLRTVAIRFTDAEVESILSRRTGRGNVISYSHLKVLSRVWNFDVRRQFLDAVYAEDLTSEQLRRRIIAWETGGTSPTAVTAGAVADVLSMTIAATQAI